MATRSLSRSVGSVALLAAYCNIFLSTETETASPTERPIVCRCSTLKLAFHDADTDILARILADTRVRHARFPEVLFLRQAERHADILATILARMSASWNSSLRRSIEQHLSQPTHLHCSLRRRATFTRQRRPDARRQGPQPPPAVGRRLEIHAVASTCTPMPVWYQITRSAK